MNLDNIIVGLKGTDFRPILELNGGIIPVTQLDDKMFSHELAQEALRIANEKWGGILPIDKIKLKYISDSKQLIQYLTENTIKIYKVLTGNNLKGEQSNSLINIPNPLLLDIDLGLGFGNTGLHTLLSLLSNGILPPTLLYSGLNADLINNQLLPRLYRSEFNKDNFAIAHYPKTGDPNFDSGIAIMILELIRRKIIEIEKNQRILRDSISSITQIISPAIDEGNIFTNNPKAKQELLELQNEGYQISLEIKTCAYLFINQLRERFGNDPRCTADRINQEEIRKNIQSDLESYNKIPENKRRIHLSPDDQKALLERNWGLFEWLQEYILKLHPFVFIHPSDFGTLTSSIHPLKDTEAEKHNWLKREGDRIDIGHLMLGRYSIITDILQIGGIIPPDNDITDDIREFIETNEQIRRIKELTKILHTKNKELALYRSLKTEGTNEQEDPIKIGDFYSLLQNNCNNLEFNFEGFDELIFGCLPFSKNFVENIILQLKSNASKHENSNKIQKIECKLITENETDDFVEIKFYSSRCFNEFALKENLYFRNRHKNCRIPKEQISSIFDDNNPIVINNPSDKDYNNAEGVKFRYSDLKKVINNLIQNHDTISLEDLLNDEDVIYLMNDLISKGETKENIDLVINDKLNELWQYPDNNFEFNKIIKARDEYGRLIDLRKEIGYGGNGIESILNSLPFSTKFNMSNETDEQGNKNGVFTFKVKVKKREVNKN